jgi:sugar transferase (PEP-CTERM/EpsH1 system associated)
MRNGRPKILFLAHLLPWPLEGGGQIKSYHTLRILALEYEVTLLAFIRSEAERENIAPLEPLCVGGVHVVSLPRGKARDVRIAATSLLRGKSFLVARDACWDMNLALFRLLSEERYVIHVDHLQMAQFLDEEVKETVVLDNHNIEHRIPKRIAETDGGNPFVRWYARTEWPRLRAFEQSACRRADMVLAVSEEDAEGLRALVPDRADRVKAVPIGVDTDYFAVAERKPESKTLLSIGTMYWPPNVDSMLYFHSEIWPKVKARVPEAQLNIVGARPTTAIRALGETDSAITVTGSVPDVRPYGADCGAFIVPLRSGSGMRVKILNALAMGLPAVSTTVGAEGIEITDGENILLADTPEAFADATVRLLTEPGLSARLGAAGRRLMEERYSWDVTGRTLLAAYRELLTGRKKAGKREGAAAR